MPDFLVSIIDWVDGTQVPAQVREVDFALFQNPYFLVPFIAMVVYFLYKQAFTNLMISGLVIGFWWFSGTDMVRGAISAEGELQLSKVLPVVGISVAGVAVLVYLLFIRTD